MSGVQWSFTHTAEEIRARLPASMQSQDSSVDADAISSVVATLARDGMFRPEHIESAHEILSVTQERVRGSTSKLSDVYTNEFVKPESR
jgi:hypothetical protein